MRNLRAVPDFSRLTLIKPKVIVALGASRRARLLRTLDPISRLRAARSTSIAAQSSSRRSIRTCWNPCVETGSLQERYETRQLRAAFAEFLNSEVLKSQVLVTVVVAVPVQALTSPHLRTVFPTTPATPAIWSARRGDRLANCLAVTGVVARGTGIRCRRGGMAAPAFARRTSGRSGCRWTTTRAFSPAPDVVNRSPRWTADCYAAGAGRNDRTAGGCAEDPQASRPDAHKTQHGDRDPAAGLGALESAAVTRASSEETLEIAHGRRRPAGCRRPRWRSRGSAASVSTKRWLTRLCEPAPGARRSRSVRIGLAMRPAHERDRELTSEQAAALCV